MIFFSQTVFPQSIQQSTQQSGQLETVFRLARIQENHDWLLPLFLASLFVFYFYRRYRIDAADLSVWQRTPLFLLRCLALVGLLFAYLSPQWEHLVGHSRVAVLVDTSASMANRDVTLPAALVEETDVQTEPSRLEAVTDWMKRSQLLERLQEKHEVVQYTFDQSLHPLENTPKIWQANGENTHLGDALFDVYQRERGQPLTGIILLSDGRQNAGRSVDAALEVAGRLQIPIFPMGVGATTPPLNFRVGQLDLPDRAFFGDPFSIRVPIEVTGLTNQNENDPPYPAQNWPVVVEIWLASDADTNRDNSAESAPLTETKLAEAELQFSDAGTLETELRLQPSEIGRQRLTVRLRTPPEDHNETDNTFSTPLEIVDRQDRILLFASAPTRDYQFLSVQIFRDKSMTADAFLPWALPGISQYVEKILPQFPSTAVEMSDYDLLVAFDPDWTLLSNEQIRVLEHWIARQGGGLLIFSGAIQQGNTLTGWVTDPNLELIRKLYPVEFSAQPLGGTAAFEHRYRAGEQAWPIKFSSASLEAAFLQPIDVSVESQSVESRSFWENFPGFFGYFSVKGIKPTATLLASSGSPDTQGRDESGALFVEQFYGAGRVFYIGSSELWRLRRSSEQAFEKLSTKLMRHVAQGRLLRESDRASLALDQSRYALGSMAELRITANDAQLQPLTEPTLFVEMLTPGGAKRDVTATLDPNVPGVYNARIPLVEEGTWTFRLPIAASDEEISRSVLVQMRGVERENPSRNERLLQEIAQKSGGIYYDSLEKADAVVDLLPIRSQRAVLDKAAQEKMLRILVALICGALLLEWTLRRLMKLL